MHLIIAPKIEMFYFFLTHCTKLTKNHENKFASSIKMFFPNTYKTVCVKAINLQWKYTYLFILTLSLSSWNCPVGPFYLVSMLGEVKDPTQGVNV